VIGGLLFNDQVVATALHLMLGKAMLPWPYWLAPLFGMLLWAPVFALLDTLRWQPKKKDT